MKVITIKQPYATLIAEGIKKYEFRSWKTNYRGKILIHAGAGIEKNEMKKFEDLDLEYPSKRIIAEAELVDCIELDDELNDINLCYNIYSWDIINMISFFFAGGKNERYIWFC